MANIDPCPVCGTLVNRSVNGDRCWKCGERTFGLPEEQQVRCRHCGEVNPDDHQDGCPQVRAEERAAEQPVPDGTDMIIPERDEHDPL